MTTGKRGLLGLLLVALAWSLMLKDAQAEPYIAAFAGWSLPQKLQDSTVQQPNALGVVGATPGQGLSELQLGQTLMYGFKAGYYFNSLRFLGAEAEVYSSTPNIKQQAVTAGGGPPTIIRGRDLRVNGYGANLLFRVPGERLQPYVGIGPAVYQARLDDGSESSVRLGVNAQAGMRWLMTKHLMLFGEYKYNLVKFNFDSFETQYQAHNLLAGIGWNF